MLGRVYDGEGKPIPDALMEILQADALGKYASSRSEACRRLSADSAASAPGTDPRQEFRFQTVKPGATKDGQAPHLNVIVLMRGLLVHAFTRAYFEGEAANATDPVLRSVPAARRKTLIASSRRPAGRPPVYRFDIRMQGPDETVFFDT